MEAPPAAALVVSEPEFLLEFLVVALDAPTQLRKIDQALRTRKRAKRDEYPSAEPSRHLTSAHASCGRPSASALTEVGGGSRSRRINLGGRPRPDQALGGDGRVPGPHTDVLGRMPATYDSPSALIPVRKSVSLPYPASISATPSGRPASTAVRI